MSRTTQADIRLRQAAAKFTKAKAAMDEPTKRRDVAYRKAKRELWDARQIARLERIPTRRGDAQAQLTTLSVKSKKETK